MIKIYAVNIENPITRDELNSLTTYLSPEKLEKIKRFYHYNDFKRSLISDILVRCEICQRTDLKNKDIFFDANEYGKPFLRGNNAFHFNISHAGDWVVMAIHYRPLGVDIEEIRPVEMNLAKRFFSKTEYHDLMKKNDLEQLGYFYELWSLKESFIKAVGKGLSIPLRSFSFSVNNDQIEFIPPSDEYCHQIEYYFKTYNIDIKYKMALCVPDEDKLPSQVEIKRLSKLYEEAKIYLG